VSAVERRFVVAFAAAGLGACGGSHATPDTTGGGDAAIVDFYRDRRVFAGCSGTLVSPLVVLTAAHCADGSEGARVRVAGAVSQTAEVAQVLTYDWSEDVEHDEEHDLALLVLRQPLAASSYARLTTDEPVGDVSILGRSSQDGRMGVEATRTDGVIMSADAPAGRPFAVLVSPGIADGGGAVRRPDGAIVGVVMGRGKSSGDGYVARVDDRLVALWVQGVAAAVAEGAIFAAETSESATATNEGGAHFAALAEAQTLLDPANPSAAPLVATAEPLADSSTPLLEQAGAGTSYDRVSGIRLSSPIPYTPFWGSNYWYAKRDDPDDDAFSGSLLAAAQHPSANYIFAHGTAGWMVGWPPRAAIRAPGGGTPGPPSISSCAGGGGRR
jgi:hypothetical protein